MKLTVSDLISDNDSESRVRLAHGSPEKIYFVIGPRSGCHFEFQSRCFTVNN